MYGLLGYATLQRIVDRRRRRIMNGGRGRARGRGRGGGSGGFDLDGSGDGGGSSGGGSDHSRSPRGHAEPWGVAEYTADMSELIYRRGLLVGGVAAASAASSSADASRSEAQLATASIERGLGRVMSGDDTEWDRGVTQVAAARACFHAAFVSWDAVLAKVEE